MTIGIVVADSIQARFFLVAFGDATRHHLPTLKEVQSLSGAATSPRVDGHGKGRGGLNRAPHGVTYQYDDHRERHHNELKRRFAKEVAEAISSFASRAALAKLIIVAAPSMLGLLRPTLAKSFPRDRELIELAEDLGRQSRERIVSTLTRRQVLAANLRQ